MRLDDSKKPENVPGEFELACSNSILIIPITHRAELDETHLVPETECSFRRFVKAGRDLLNVLIRAIL